MFVDQKHQKNFRTAKTTRSHYDRIFPINRSARLLQYFLGCSKTNVKNS